MVSFLSIFSLILETCKSEWHNRGPSKDFLVEFWYEMQDYLTLRKQDFGFILVFALLISLFRQQTTTRLLKPLAQKFKFRSKDKLVFPESCFKLLLYFIFYTIECVILLLLYPEFLTDPLAPWRGWHVGMEVSSEIYWIYVAEAGFYVHGIYGVFFMDVWRDDSALMVLHHILTICLIVFSLGLRYHRIGLVVLFLHDIADVFLEFTKVVKCFQNRKNSSKTIYGHIVTLGFVCFAISWIICRMVVYPITVLFSAGHEGRKILPDAPFYFFFNGLLWILFGMNFYWSCYIVRLVYRVLTNRSKGIEDPREESLTNEEFQNVDDIQQVKLAEKAKVLNGNSDIQPFIQKRAKSGSARSSRFESKNNNKFKESVIFELAAKKEHFN